MQPQLQTWPWQSGFAASATIAQHDGHASVPGGRETCPPVQQGDDARVLELDGRVQWRVAYFDQTSSYSRVMRTNARQSQVLSKRLKLGENRGVRASARADGGSGTCPARTTATCNGRKKGRQCSRFPVQPAERDAPSLSLHSGVAPLLRRYCTIALWPISAAWCSGVCWNCKGRATPGQVRGSLGWGAQLLWAKAACAILFRRRRRVHNTPDDVCT